jgi:hypothetical protein
MAEQRKMNKFIVIVVGLIYIGVLYVMLKDSKEKYVGIGITPSNTPKTYGRSFNR